MTDNCPICFEGICDTVLNCGHKVHEDCLSQMIHQSDPECRITYSPIKCPLCRVVFQPNIGKIDIQGILDVCREAEDTGMKQLQKDYEEKEVIEILAQKSVLEVAIMRQCQACACVYFDGYSSCAARIPGEVEDDLNADRVYQCRACNASEKGKSCEQHGYSFGIMKCIYCCIRVSTYHCGGEFYCCTPCHGDLQGNGISGFTPLECPGDETCLFHGSYYHPPNTGAEGCFMLNCGGCDELAMYSDPHEEVLVSFGHHQLKIKENYDDVNVDGIENMFRMNDRRRDPPEDEYAHVEAIDRLFARYDRPAKPRRVR